MTDSANILSADDAKRAARNAGVLIVASIISKGILFGWQIVLATLLGPFNNGVYNTVLGLLAIAAPIASFGMGLIIIRDVASTPDKIVQYRSAALMMQTVLSLLAYIGAIAGAVLAGYSESIVVFTAIAGLSLFVDLYGNLHHDLLLAQERMLATSVVDIVHIILRVGLAAFLLLAGFGLWGVYAAAIITGIIRSIVLIALNWHYGLKLDFAFDRQIARRLLINSLPLALTAFLTLSYNHADKLMTTAIIGETNTGYLAPAFMINFGVIELLSTSVLVALFPLMSRIYDAGKNPLFGLLVEKVGRFILIITLPIALIISIFAHDLIAFIYPPEYAPTGSILRIFIWFTAITITGNVFSKALLIQNRQRLLLIIKSAGLALNIILNTILLTQFKDARGAAIASIIAELLIVGLMLWHFRATGFNPTRNIAALLRLALFTLLSGAAMLLLQDTILVALIAGGIIYLAGLLFGGVLNDDDFDLIYRLLSAIPGGNFIRRYWTRDISVRW